MPRPYRLTAVRAGQEKEKKRAGQDKKKMLFRPGTQTVALRTILKYVKSQNLILRQLPFQRLVLEIAQDIAKVRFTELAFLALQEGSEDYLASIFEDANLCTVYRRRSTIQLTDMQLVRRIRGLKCFDSA
jgi:histone H3